MTTGVYAGLWEVLPCTNKEKYVCKHLAQGAVLTAAPPTLPTPKCMDGWKPVGTRHMCAKVRLYVHVTSRAFVCSGGGGDLTLNLPQVGCGYDLRLAKTERAEESKIVRPNNLPPKKIFPLLPCSHSPTFLRRQGVFHSHTCDLTPLTNQGRDAMLYKQSIHLHPPILFVELTALNLTCRTLKTYH